MITVAAHVEQDGVTTDAGVVNVRREIQAHGGDGGVAAIPGWRRRVQTVQRSTGISSRLPLGWSARVCSTAPPMRETEGST